MSSWWNLPTRKTIGFRGTQHFQTHPYVNHGEKTRVKSATKIPGAPDFSWPPPRGLPPPPTAPPPGRAAPAGLGPEWRGEWTSGKWGKHGSLNVPIEHHPTIRYMVYNGYYKVMSNSPKMGHLPIPGKQRGKHQENVGRTTRNWEKIWGKAKNNLERIGTWDIDRNPAKLFNVHQTRSKIRWSNHVETLTTQIYKKNVDHEIIQQSLITKIHQDLVVS